MALSTTNRVKEMEANLNNDAFVFDGLALIGQITLFYGWPNTGKTILFFFLLIEAIKAGRIKGEDVIYINADDSYKGLYTKTKIAAEIGIKMISPAESGIDPKEILKLITAIANDDMAKNKIVVLDTLKKFANMMDKNSQACLYTELRKFIAKGGTVIIAGHANKHKDAEGNLIYEGTSDTMNDVDCVYSLYRMSAPEDELQIVEFRREKDRGDVVPKASFQYTKRTGMHYMDMLNSVTRMDASEVERVKTKAIHDELKAKFETEILVISGLLRTEGKMNQTAILEAFQKDKALKGETSERSIKIALDKLTGIIWEYRRGDKNAKIFSLIGWEADQYRRASGC
jgi:hypothetical protein